MTFNTRMNESIDAADVVATGTVITGVGRIRGMYVRTTGTEGTVVLKDGGASGTELLTLNTPAVEGHSYIEVPGGGIEYATDVHGTLTNVDGITIFYAKGN